MRTLPVTPAVALLLSATLQAQTPQDTTRPARTPKPGATATRQWKPAPAVFPAGARMAVIKGDPAKAAPFTVELSMPDGYRVPPHFHPTAEHVVVRSGTLLVGMGDTVDLARAKVMTRGQSGDIAARMHHFAAARGATVIAVSAQGPFALTYVNPADDPQRTAAKQP